MRKERVDEEELSMSSITSRLRDNWCDSQGCMKKIVELKTKLHTETMALKRMDEEHKQLMEKLVIA